MPTMPGLLISHGAPTLVLEETPLRGFLQQLGQDLPRPRAILCISAHWETRLPLVTGSASPATIHDFGGFPPALYQMTYPAPGDPGLAAEIAGLLQAHNPEADIDAKRGLDHGAWVPLTLMYPQADIPVIQLSIQTHRGPQYHLRLGQALRPLRERGILLLGSGSVTHNLSEFRHYSLASPPPDWVQAFDLWLKEKIEAGDTQALLDYRSEAPHAARNHPTEDHILPLFPILGACYDQPGRCVHASYTYGVLSMAAYTFG